MRHKNKSKFSNFLSLVMATNINAILPPTCADNTEFQIVARDTRHGHLRTFSFKCDTPKQRDFWVKGLNTHKTHLGNVMRMTANTALKGLDVDDMVSSSNSMRKARSLIKPVNSSIEYYEETTSSDLTQQSSTSLSTIASIGTLQGPPSEAPDDAEDLRPGVL